MISALPLPCVVVDLEERIAALNAQAEALLGAGLAGRHFITALRQPMLVEAVETCLSNRAAQTSEYLSTQSQSDIRYSVTLAAIDAQYILLSFHDTSPLAQADQMRRDFVANVSHELRTPLTSLMGFIETLRGPARADPQAQDRFLGVMTQEAARMNRLISDLLSLSRVEAQERVRPTERVDIQQVLQTTLRNLNPIAVEHDTALHVSLGEGPLSVLGDADQLQQVFTNLIENAIKYGGGNGGKNGEDGQNVDISAKVMPLDPALRGPALRVSISDHGPGIDARHIPRLTERFYRVDTHRSRDLGGTGLGLAIVKHILNRHRGRLKITSTPQEGTIFTVILPMEQDPR